MSDTTPILHHDTPNQALLRIHALMDSKEWNADTLDAIAEILQEQGLPINPPHPG